MSHVHYAGSGQLTVANRNAELAVPLLFWSDHGIKVGGNVALLSGPTVYSLYTA